MYQWDFTPILQNSGLLWAGLLGTLAITGTALAFALPILIDVRMTPFLAAAITFSIQSSAFFAEIFRGGIQSIDPGQWEAGRAIGMRYREIMARIMLPQAVHRMLPALTNRGIEIFKITTLASAICALMVSRFSSDQVTRKLSDLGSYHKPVRSIEDRQQSSMIDNRRSYTPVICNAPHPVRTPSTWNKPSSPAAPAAWPRPFPPRPCRAPA